MSCVVPKDRDVLLLVKSGDVVVSPVSDVLVRQDVAQTLVSQTRTQMVVSRSPGRVVESSQIRFVRSDPAAPAIPPAIEVVLMTDQWSVIDSIAWGLVDSMVWRVSIDSPGGATRHSMFIAATHNGYGANPPDQVKWTKFGVIRFGEDQSLVDLALENAGAGSRMQLRVQAGPNYRVKVWRIQALG